MQRGRISNRIFITSTATTSKIQVLLLRRGFQAGSLHWSVDRGWQLNVTRFRRNWGTAQLISLAGE